MERELYGVYDAIIPSIIKITVHTHPSIREFMMQSFPASLKSLYMHILGPPRSSSDFDVSFDYYFIGKSPETVEHFFR